MSLQHCPPSTAKHVNNTPDPFSVILLGTGVAGLSAAQRLLSAGHRVALISPDSQCGGFHQNDQIGPYSFDRGSIFYEETSRLFDLAPGLREMCPTVRREQRRVTPNNAILRYPFEASELAAWKKSQMASAVLDLATARLRYQLDGSLDRICHRRLGKTIYCKTGLRDYIERFNHIDPAQIDESFFFHRMGPIDRETQLKTMMTKAKRAVGIGRVPKKVWPALYVRPAEGYGPIFERIQRTLEADGAQFYMGERPIKIMRDAAGFHVVSEKGTYTADALVSSAPIGTIYKMLTGEDAGLQSLDLLTLYVSADTLDDRTGNVLYNFSREGAWKRATIYSRIYPELGSGRAFFSVEITVPLNGTSDAEVEFDAVKKHFEAVGLGRGLRLEGSAYTPHCYPLYRVGEGERIKRVIDRVTEAGVVTIGRQGRFEYLPTASGVIRRVGQELEQQSLLRPALI